MQIAHFQTSLEHIFTQGLSHLFGQRGNQHALAFGGGIAAFGDDIIDLIARWPDDTFWIGQSGRANDLFGNPPAGALHLITARRCRHIDRLRPEPFPFFKFQGPVIHTGWQAESVFGQCRFTRIVTFIHRPQLGYGDMAFIDNQQGIFRQIFKQCRRWLARTASRQIA